MIYLPVVKMSISFGWSDPVTVDGLMDGSGVSRVTDLLHGQDRHTGLVIGGMQPPLQRDPQWGCTAVCRD